MRTIATLLATLSLLALVPAPAQAHVEVCAWDDPVCVVVCELEHGGGGIHACGIENPPRPTIERHSCPSGQSGAVLVVGGQAVPACAARPTVGAAPCQSPEVGATVTVGDDTVDACLPEPVRVEECPWWQNGYVVYVFGMPMTTCFV